MEPEETRVFITILIAGIIFCMVVIFFLITTVSYQKKSVAAYLDRMKADLSLLERERARMATDVHDEFGSQLSSIKLMMDDFVSGNEDKETLEGKVANAISNMMLSVRQLSNNMVPYALQREGLLFSLDELIAALFAGSSIHIVSEWKIKESDITEENKIHVYRIIQELFSNIIKHAHASNIHVCLQPEKKKIQLHLSDDGTGFNQKLIQKSSQGLGLRNIMARVNVMKGSVYLNTHQGKGTVYLIELPTE